jgi:predicted CXXCH cytochrome family protein
MEFHDYDASCSRPGCHAQLTATRWVHGPVAVGRCEICHRAEDDPRAHRFRPPPRGGGLCRSCHHLAPSTGFHVHDPFAASDCTGCHDPHGGSNVNLLREARAVTVCRRCHGSFDDPIPHRPIENGDCLACHDAHEAPYANLLVRPEPELCMGCHPRVGDGPQPDGRAREPVHTDCGACHQPHGGRDATFLRPDVQARCLGCHEAVGQSLAAPVSLHAATREGRGCRNCHAAHAKRSAHLLVEAQPGLCYECHDRVVRLPSGRTIPNIRNQIDTARYRHDPVARGECGSCHLPHGSPYGRLLCAGYPMTEYADYSDATYALCFLCHDRALVSDEQTTTATGFRDGDRNLHSVHVKRRLGRVCTLCHEMHVAEAPHLMRRSIPYGDTGWKLPINYVETENGGFCASGCHRERGYVNAPPPEEAR